MKKINSKNTEKKIIKIIKVLTLLAGVLLTIVCICALKTELSSSLEKNIYDYIGLSCLIFGLIISIIILILMNSIENVKEKLDQRLPKKRSKNK